MVQLNDAAVRQGIVKEVIAYIAPKLIGGKDAKTPVDGMGFQKLKDAVLLTDTQCEKIGEDLKITALVKERSTEKEGLPCSRES